MVAQCAGKITDLLVEEQVISVESREIYQYGAELILSTALDLFLILGIGLCLKSVGEGICYFAVLATIRTQSGGFHASSYFRCGLLYCMLFGAVTMAARVADYVAINSALLLLCLCINTWYIWWYAPVLHNKDMEESYKKHAKRKATARCIIWTLIAVVFLLVNRRYAYAIAASVTEVSILMMVEKRRS